MFDFMFYISFIPTYYIFRYGYCSKAIVRSNRKQCLSKGHSWNSFSISGHAFILIYCTLIIMEEAKALVCWETIKDHLRNEEHNRSSENSGSITPLDLLSSEQLSVVKEKYETFTPYIRLSFVAMTVLALLWDVMLMVIHTHKKYLKIISDSVIYLCFSRQQLFTFIQLQRNLLRV